MLRWISRLFRRTPKDAPAKHVDAITNTAHEMRRDMIEETRLSQHAQRELRHDREMNWVEDDLLQRLAKRGRQENA